MRKCIAPFAWCYFQRPIPYANCEMFEGLWRNIQLCGDFLSRADARQIRSVTCVLPAIEGGLTGKVQALIDRPLQIGALVGLSRLCARPSGVQSGRPSGLYVS